MEATHALAGVAGAVVVIGVWSSVVRTLVVPRGLRSPLTALAQKATIGLFKLLARPIKSVESRDQVLAWGAPLSILVTLVVWILGFVIGYSLLVTALSEERGAGQPAGGRVRAARADVRREGRAGLAHDRRPVRGGDRSGGHRPARRLPADALRVVQPSRDRRDDARGARRRTELGTGDPGAARVDRIARRLDGFFRDWERWAADISESHTNYPVLVYVRSARPLRNWLVGMISVMDAAALHLALAPRPRDEFGAAWRCAMGFVCMRDIADGTTIAFDPDPMLRRPDPADVRGVPRRRRAARARGYPMERTPEEAWPHFRGWRVNYEAIAYELADRIDAVPAPWTGARHRDGLIIQPRTPINRLPGGGHGPLTPDGT